MAWTEPEIRKVIEDGWKMYRDVPRVTMTVDLHAAAFAFGSPVGLVAKADQIQRIPVNVDAELLADIGRKLYIAGEAGADVRFDDGVIRIEPGEGLTITFAESSSLGLVVPPGELWSTARNYDALLLATNSRMKDAAQIMIDTTLASMLPWALFDSQQASQLPAVYVADRLVVLVSTVQRMQHSVGWYIREHLKGQLNLWDVEWEPELHPQGPSASMATWIELANFYRILRGFGVDLQRVKSDALTMANESEQLRIARPSDIAAIRRAFSETG